MKIKLEPTVVNMSCVNTPINSRLMRGKYAALFMHTIAHICVYNIELRLFSQLRIKIKLMPNIIYTSVSKYTHE